MKHISVKIGNKPISKCKKAEILEYVNVTLELLNKYLALAKKTQLVIQAIDDLDIKELTEIARWLNNRQTSELAACVGIRRMCSEEVWISLQLLGNAGMWEVKEMKAAFAKLNKAVFSLPRPGALKLVKSEKVG